MLKWLGDGVKRPQAKPETANAADEPESPCLPKQEARLEDWSEYGVGLRGFVYGHPLFLPGREVHTSQIVKMDESAGVAETLHTFYRLGKKR